MENTGVRCDVCECRHNVGSSKCDLSDTRIDGALPVLFSQQWTSTLQSYEKK